ncbi:MAG TPA: C-terminal binding protein [Pirellulales bacterium]|jgi:D-3-phosphoglycerate dehydrogenase/C-terminal binding protein|nr:C-terminal binding protein [Pirellulales bacterium]
MSRFLVAITDFVTGSLEPEEKILGDIADVVALNGFHENEIVDRLENAHAMMVYHNLSITRPTLERLKCCKLIVRCGVGIDNVDYKFARTRGIPMCNVPDYGTEDVADSAIGMALALTRGIHRQNSQLRAGLGEWLYTQAAPLQRLRGKVFAIVGFGRIGTAVALRAKAMGMDVVFYDPLLPDGNDKSIGVRRAETPEELLRQAYIVSLHCPLTEESRHFINAQSLAWLPKGSYLVNTSRGAVVDTSAISAAIASGQLAGAALDVLPQEPPAENDPLIRAWRDPNHPAHHRLIVNPHAAFYTEQGFRDMRTKGAAAIRRALTGQRLRNVVN